MKHTILYLAARLYIAELWLDAQRNALQARKGGVITWQGARK